MTRSLQILEPAWYCARTKPKHEHIAAADVQTHLGLEVFHPRFRAQRTTRTGVLKRVTEPLFPCYIFIRCAIDETLKDIRRANGISHVVHFGDRIPTVPDAAIAELKACFAAAELMPESDRFQKGDEVILTEGAFAGMHASVLRVLSARQRVQVMLDILGRPTTVEVGWNRVVPKREDLSELGPFLA